MPPGWPGPGGGYPGGVKFAHLHQHTQYSLLDGAAKLKDLLAWVKKVSPENPALAITDHGNLFGAVDFYRLAHRMGVKPIIGYEAYVAAESRFDRKRRKGLDGGYYHLTLIAKNFKGYQNLVKLASRAYLEGFYEKPRIDRELLAEHSEGLIVLSGCLGSEINQFILAGREDLAEARLNEYLSIFKDDFFIEIQNHGLKEQQRTNAVLKEFARKYGIGMVATNDGHYVSRKDAEAHEVLLAIQSKSTWDDENRWKFPCDEFYVKDPEEMRQALPPEEWGEEIFDNSVWIAEIASVELPLDDKKRYQIPRYPLPEGRDEAQYLRELTFLGLLERYPDRITEDFYREMLRVAGAPVPHGDGAVLAEALALLDGEAKEKLLAELPDPKEVREWDAPAILARALYELEVIERMGFPGYFLIVQDYINWAKRQKISVGPGRGSAAGSLVAYATRITNIDPLAFNLLFERFLNPARVSMPDIDTDFSDVRRDEVIEYVRKRYGEDRVAQIATFGTMASKAAIKDVARVFGIPHKRAEEIAKLVPVKFGRPIPLQEAIETVPELRAMMDSDPEVRRVLEVAMRLEGLNRHASVHAAGVVIGAEPLTELVPLMKETGGGDKIITQYDMNAVEALGLLKMDFLGLRTLSFLEEAARIVRESRGIELDYDRIPLDDAATFELLARGETKGVFQLEGSGMTATVKAFRPERVHDLIAILSLYRPGPMDNIPTYIRRKQGKEPVSYAEFPHAEKHLAPILEETYGIPVYQEQIMQIASAVAGYSLGEADLLRRAMGKKKVEEMKRHRERFIKGAAERGIPEEEASRLFDMLEAFANYGFNKCLPATARVVDVRSGRRVTIGEIVRGEAGEVWVPSLDEKTLKIVPRPVVAAFPSGRRPVFRIVTETGRTLRATANHPFYTPEGWRDLGAIRPGDYVALPRRVPYQSQNRMPSHELALLAYAIAEGNLEHPSGFYLYSKDPELVQAFVDALEAFPNTRAVIDESKPATSVYAARENRSGVCGAVDFLKRAGILGKGAAEKFVPEDVFTLSPEQIAFFLGRLWSGDGGIQPETRLIHYATASRRLAEDVQHLLLRLGLQTRIHEKSFAYRGERRKGYAVHLLGGWEAVEAFAEKIGPHLQGKRRRDLGRLLAEGAPQGARSTKDILPNALLPLVLAEIKAAARARGKGYHAYLAEHGISSGLFRPNATKRDLARKMVAHLAGLTQSFLLARLAESDLYWDRVVAVIPDGEEAVYDLTVEGTHTFVAEDMVVHNSHAAAYAMIAYQTAYVKAHYPVEFMAALLTVERKNSDKVAEYIRDARAMGIPVLPPDINKSGFDFRVVGEEILFGLSAVKNVGEGAVEAILAERERRGPFKSLADFLKRVDLHTVNRRAVESLIKAGAFDAFGERGAMLAGLDALLKWAATEQEKAGMGLTGLFDEAAEPALPKAPRLGEVERLKMEKEALGIYVTGHPLAHYAGLVEAASARIADLPRWYRGQNGGRRRVRAILTGMVENVVRKPTKNGGMMARFNLADESGAIEVVVFGRGYDRVSPRLKEDTPVAVVASVEPDAEGESLRVIAEDLFLWDEFEGLPKRLELRLDLADLDEKRTLELRSLLDEHPGPHGVQIRLFGPSGWALFEASEVRVGEDALEAVLALGIKASFVPDREALLAGHDRGGGSEAIPF